MADNQIDPYACMARLNKHCQKNHLQLEYRDIFIAASSHDHVFTVAVVIDKVQYEPATGKTKKEARALAAVLAWNTIQEQKKGELDSCEQRKDFTSPNSINYVSCLNEYASKNNLQVYYKCTSKTGVQHEPVFSYACLIDKEKFGVGSGNKIKVARNEAAKLAYEKLTSSSTIGAEECTNCSSDSFHVTFRNSQGQRSMDHGACGSTTDLDLKLEKTSDTVTQHADPIQLNESSSSQSSGELNSCEQRKDFTSPNSINYVSCLNEYASKNNLQVYYKCISKTGVQHKPVFSYACLIDNEEFGVGSGNKIKVAKNEAAKLAYEKLTSSSTIGAEECTNCSSDSFEVVFCNSQGQRSMDHGASGSATDLDVEPEKTSDAFTQHADASQLNESSSSQSSVSAPSQSMKPKRKESPLGARFSNLCTRTSKFTKNDRFLEEFDDIEKIGSGGFGNVFKAKHIIDCRLCAIKRILSSETDEEKREVKALAKLDHPHIVRYYYCWNGEDIFHFPDTRKSSSEEYKCLFIQMEFCEKGNLSDWLDKGVSCKDVAITLFQQIVEGVDYIHSNNLIHRDLKPLNIFFHSENHIKIGDFGLATLAVTDGQRTTSKGTVYYMAPEQGGKWYDKKVDIFPLGLILYEMLSPFPTMHEKDKEWRKIKERELPEAFTKKFTKETSLIMKLLSKEPSQRPSAADILKILKDQPHTRHTY